MYGEGNEIINSSKCGFSINSGKVSDFTNALNKLIKLSNDHRLKMGLNGKNTMKAIFHLIEECLI